MADHDFPAADSFQGPAELRAAYDRAIKAVKERDQRIVGMEGELKGHRISAAGFPEGSEGHRLLTDFYQGDLADKAALAEFAGKYGHKPGTPTAPAVPDPVERADQKLTQLGAAGVPIVPAGEQERLAAEVAKAESEHRIADAIRLKNQLHSLVRASGKG